MNTKIVALKRPKFEWQGTEETLLKCIEGDGIPLRLIEGKECYVLESASKGYNEELKETFYAATYSHYGTATSAFQAKRFMQGHDTEILC